MYKFDITNTLIKHSYYYYTALSLLFFYNHLTHIIKDTVCWSKLQRLDLAYPNIHKMDPIIGKGDMVFSPFLIADFWYFFVCNSSSNIVGQGPLAALIILYQLTFRTDDKSFLIHCPWSLKKMKSHVL